MHIDLEKCNSPVQSANDQGQRSGYKQIRLTVPPQSCLPTVQNINCDFSEGLDAHMRLIISSLVIAAIMSLSAARTIRADIVLSDKLVRKRLLIILSLIRAHSADALETGKQHRML